MQGRSRLNTGNIMQYWFVWASILTSNAQSDHVDKEQPVLREAKWCRAIDCSGISAKTGLRCWQYRVHYYDNERKKKTIKSLRNTLPTVATKHRQLYLCDIGRLPKLQPWSSFNRICLTHTKLVSPRWACTRVPNVRVEAIEVTLAVRMEQAQIEGYGMRPRSSLAWIWMSDEEDVSEEGRC